jgi:DNA-binding response OmpR family regulator
MENTVLIIEEDSPRVRLLGWALDQETDYQVLIAPSADRMSTVAVRPRFIVFNTHMAVRDKRLWIQALRYLVPGVAVIDLHEPAVDDDRDGSGADAYLAKPYHVSSLVEIMVSLNERARR